MPLRADVINWHVLSRCTLRSHLCSLIASCRLHLVGPWLLDCLSFKTCRVDVLLQLIDPLVSQVDLFHRRLDGLLGLLLGCDIAGLLRGHPLIDVFVDRPGLRLLLPCEVLLLRQLLTRLHLVVTRVVDVYIEHVPTNFFSLVSRLINLLG